MSDYRVLDTKKQVHDFEDAFKSVLPFNEGTLRALKWYYVPDDCAVGDTVILDGIECLCVATNVEIQDSDYKRIAVDKNYNLDHYFNYIGTYVDGYEITQSGSWRWGAYNVTVGASNTGVGYGLRNTEICLNDSRCFSCANNTSNSQYPIMWYGVRDFRNEYSNDWFVPSMYEAQNCMYPYANVLGLRNNHTWTSAEYSATTAYFLTSNGGWSDGIKYSGSLGCRMCRAF